LLWLTARAALAVQARIRAALGIYENKLGPDHHSTKDVTKSLEQLEGAAAQPGGANAPEPPREHTGRPGARCCGMSALYGPSPLKHVIVWKFCRVKYAKFQRNLITSSPPAVYSVTRTPTRHGGGARVPRQKPARAVV
jgi:hypothetical protein